MYRLILATTPSTGNQVGRYAHKPRVAVLVRRSGLAAHFARDIVGPAQTSCRTRTNHVLQHSEHRVGGLLADGVLGGRNERSQQVALTVLDTCHEDRLGVHASVGEGTECTCQLEQRRLRRAEAQCPLRVDVAVDTHIVNEISYGSGLLRLLHNPSRVVVAAICQTPAQRVKFAVVRVAVGLLRRPRRTVVGLDRNGLVHHLRAGCKSQVVNGKGVDEWFDRRADLSLTLLSQIVLEIAEIGTSDVCFDVSRRGIHRHERGTQNLLVMQNRVARSHRSIAVALVGEDLHSARTLERGIDLLLGNARLVHLIVAIRVAHCVAQNALDVLFALVAEQHTRILHLTIHSRLHVRGHMLQQSLLGIFLHRRVDRGIDLQTITIDVVVRAVSLLILLTPAVERVVIPLIERLIEVPIVVELRTLGAWLIHHQSQHLAEVGCRTVVVRDGAVVELNGQCRERIVLLAREATVGSHTRHHRVSTCN